MGAIPTFLSPTRTLFLFITDALGDKNCDGGSFLPLYTLGRCSLLVSSLALQTRCVIVFTIIHGGESEKCVYAECGRKPPSITMRVLAW